MSSIILKSIGDLFPRLGESKSTSVKIPSFDSVFNDRFIASMDNYEIITYEEDDPDNIDRFLSLSNLPDDTDVMRGEFYPKYRKWIIETVIRPRYKKLYDDYVSEYSKLQGKPCYRVIMVGKDADPAKVNNIGAFWSIDRSGAGAYNFDSRKSPDNTIRCLYEGVIDFDIVDWKDTLQTRFISHNSSNDDEKEIRFFKGSRIFVKSVTVSSPKVSKHTISIKELRTV